MAESNTQISFGPFRADLAAACLRRGSETLNLRPKTWEVLRYLIDNPGRLITKDELLDKVWVGTIVTEGTLTQSIRELRAALEDDSKRPRFIATVHRRGYRFIANLGAELLDAPNAGGAPPAIVVGRDSELEQLRNALGAAVRGQRRSLFVSGDAGMGKTTILETLLRAARHSYGYGLKVARGQCVEQRGEAEPYLPILEALHDLASGEDGAQVADLLKRFAPTWVVQMPWLMSNGESEALRRQLMGTGPERMLRELNTVLGELAKQTPLLLVLEDLHWADLATIDFLGALARRRDRVPLMLVGSLRSNASGAGSTTALRRLWCKQSSATAAAARFSW